MTKKLFMDNSYLTEITGNILINQRIDDKYHIILDKTIFYPDGVGGQKGDIGTINDVVIDKSYEKDGNIVHVTSEKVSGSVGKIEIDFDNRLKIIQQHTTQHLVSQCFVRLYEIETIGFHCSDDFITIDLDVEYLDKNQIISVEDLSNSVIQNNLDVKTYYPSDEDLQNLPFRKGPKVKENIRVVEIDGFDFAPCGGTHVKSTGELGLIKIINTARQNGKTRITLVSGNLALEDYRIKSDIFDSISKELSANKDNLYDKFIKFKEEKEEISSNYSNLKNKYFELLKDKLISSEDSNVVTYNLDGMQFEDGVLLSKKFEDANKIFFAYLLESSKIIKILIKLPDNIDKDIKILKEELSQNFNFKGGGGSNSLQGVLINEDIEKVIEFIKK